MVVLAAIAAWSLSPAPVPTPPPPGRTVLWDREHPSGLRIEIVRELTWPGPYLPTFTLSHGRRMVQRLTIGFSRGPLQAFSLDLVTIGAADQSRPTMTSTRPTTEGLPIFAVRASIAVPRTAWKLSALQSFTGYASSSPTPLVARTPRPLGLPAALLWRRF